MAANPVSLPIPPPEEGDACTFEESDEGACSPDVNIWTFQMYRPFRPGTKRPSTSSRRSKKHPVAIGGGIWNDLVIARESTDLGSVSQAVAVGVQVYGCRRTDGKIVTHRTRHHNPESIFRMFSGRTAILRLFDNADECTLSMPPRDCLGIPMARGTVVVVVLDSAGDVKRHVFRLPKHTKEPWKVQGRTH